MNAKNQLKALSGIEGLESFENKLKKTDCFPIIASAPEIFQMNIGKKCNLSCRHCHVGAGPMRTEMMGEEVFKKCLKIIKRTPAVKTVDITGGAPEMNNNLKWFINELAVLNKRIIVRSNLVILTEKGYTGFIEFFAGQKVEVCASLPGCDADKTDRQRGSGVHERCIKALRQLNESGYGKRNTGLVLNLVHNPAGAYMPGAQSSIETEYRKALNDKYKIVFNNLFCITNIPVGRYLKYLIESGNLGDYMCELAKAYNPAVVPNVMCKNTISVGWDGSLYDCDFNQMLELKIDGSCADSLDKYGLQKLKGRKIRVHSHCYGCTAGSGSSCQGSSYV
jgi:radical SAM/Cys-rich protein